MNPTLRTLTPFYLPPSTYRVVLVLSSSLSRCCLNQVLRNELLVPQCHLLANTSLAIIQEAAQWVVLSWNCLFFKHLNNIITKSFHDFSFRRKKKSVRIDIWLGLNHTKKYVLPKCPILLQNIRIKLFSPKTPNKKTQPDLSVLKSFKCRRGRQRGGHKRLNKN